MTRVGIIGAGHIGSAVARGLVAQGHEVAISNSRGPETLGALVAELGDRAHAATGIALAAFLFPASDALAPDSRGMRDGAREFPPA